MMKLPILVIAVGIVLQTAKGSPLDVNCNKRTTHVETIGPGNGELIYLDRHRVACQPFEFLNGFQFTRSSDLKGFGIRNERLIEGELAAVGQFPYVVSITDENNRHFCGGFIYNDRWIVTTASCVDGKTIYRLKVVVGQVSAINPDPNEQSMAVYSIVPFPEYNSTNKMNDIALIKLSKSIPFDYENVDFIAYNQFDFDVRVGTVMGWGANMDGTYESVNLRYAAGFIVYTNASTGCGTYSDSEEFDPAIMMCCGVSLLAPPPGSPCMYDEGSPFVQELVDPANSSLVIPTAVGIFSKTPSCQLSSRSVYTRLSAYYYWLTTTAGLQPTRP